MSAYSHDYACTLTDGTPYRIAVLRGSGGREIHDDDADRLIELFKAKPELAEANWLTVHMIGPRRSHPHPGATDV